MPRTSVILVTVALLPAVAVVVAAQGLLAIKPKSCLGSGRVVAPIERQLVFETVYAQLDQGQTTTGELVPTGRDLSSLPTGPLIDSDDAVMSGYGAVLRLVYTGTTQVEAQGYSNDTDFLSTIVLDSDILSFPVSSNTSALCSAIRTSRGVTGETENEGVLVADSGCPYNGDIALGVTVPLRNSYALTTISTELLVLDPSNQALHLACYDVQVTPYYPAHWVYKLIRYAVIGMLAMYMLFYVFARAWSAYTSWLHDNETHLASSLTLKLVTTSTPLSRRKMWGAIWFNAWAGTLVVNSGSLRRFVTAEFRELFALVMWFSMVGIVAVDWPGFAYPVFAQTAWTTLIYNSSVLLPFTAPPAPLLPNNFTAPPLFAAQMNDVTSPLYLDDELPNILLDIESSGRGIERWARAVGVRKEDLWSVCAFTFFVMCAVVIAAHVVFLVFDTALDTALPSRFSKSRLRSEAKARQDGSASGSFEASSARLSMKEIGRSSGSTTTTTAASGAERRQSRDQYARGEEDNAAIDEDEDDDVGPARPEDHYPSWRLHLALLQGNLTRLLVLFHLPLSTFSIYTFASRSETPSSTFGLAVVTFALICVGVPVYLVWQPHRLPARDLYASLSHLLSLGVTYNTMSDECVMFIAVRFAANLIIAVMLGAIQSTGTAQAAVILLVEVADTLITSLWLPWGDNAAMGPLAFVLCLARIIIAVLLVVLSPTVSVSPAAASWITYIILLVQGILILLLLAILVFKFFELLIRTIGGVPFDESRSARSGGLGGALRKWDRGAGAGGQTKHRRRGGGAAGSRKARAAAAMAASRGQGRPSGDLRRREHLGPSESTVGTHTRLLDSNSNPHSHLRPGAGNYNDSSYGSSSSRAHRQHEEDEYIMSAMSSGPWAANATTATPGFVKPGAYSSSQPASKTSGPVLRSGPTWGDQATVVPAAIIPASSSASPSNTGFARIGGGRASSSNPYQLAEHSAASAYPPYPSSSADGYRAGTGAGGPPANPRRLSQSAVVEMAAGHGNGNGGGDGFAPATRHASRPSGSLQLPPPSSSALLSNTVSKLSPNEMSPPFSSTKNRNEGAAKAPAGFFGRFRRERPAMSDVSSDDDDDSDDDEDEDGDRPRGGLFGAFRVGKWGVRRRRREDDEGEEEEVPPEERGFVVTRKPRPGPPRPPQQPTPKAALEEDDSLPAPS